MIANLVQLAAEEKQNPLIPPGPELLVGAIAFAIVFFFFWKKLLPNINKVLEERREAIEGGIEKAEAAQTEAQSVLEQYKAQLAEARHEAARLRQEAQEQGAQLIAEMRAEGQRQREEIVAAGHSQIEADRKAAAQALRQDVGQLATELAGKLVGESLEDHARQSRTIDRFLDELDEKATKAEATR
ncbi:F0F1 ATP synthase subunit B [Streptomyces spectabilis]|uniref:ATP synthase subunit b n=1 Tax=Streptomyces spectabilis TaxID=68270 RepID=A0A516RDF7_STRST|nr:MULTISPECIES: F0F1 ATP synthase subunit B [Streptomyces]MBB5104496.1 F-type H+-transporting ATPase subunit b [Streptomyces spectabilis]MCI3905149.1 F0F1 ATP synthase subunit B [Streptomyces spectabilis]MCI3933079.1 F0F1 ATP synthase subunit B [Streptomyces sp. AN091965]QCX79152.1 ATP synthase subunit b [Streptomyces sp. YIM 121038]QDQ13691.1 F0F1 ATP synthase subunit B [Streptomyces spectabilis]